MGFSYHNTTNVSGDQLNRYEDAALSQEELLLAYFEDAYNSGGHYMLLTPTLALMLVFSKKVPITSVRRALSNLTRDGKLRMSGQTKGPYGRPEHYWRLVERQSQKGIVIGKGGRKIATITRKARAELGGQLGCPVGLELWVKVRAKWREQRTLLTTLGIKGK